MIGPGKYDELCTRVRIEAHAQCAIVIVLGGKLGSGFSVQALRDVTEELPRLLRDVADTIERGSGAS